MRFKRGQSIKEALKIGNDQQVLAEVRDYLRGDILMAYSEKDRYIKAAFSGDVQTWIIKALMMEIKERLGTDIKEIDMDRQNIICIKLK